jgi:hypothetical protein
MLRFTEAQWRALQGHDAQHFVAAVCDQFLAGRPDMATSPGRAEVRARMQAAHRYAESVGFTSTPHIVKLMYFAADAPRFYEDPAINAWLRKPGQTPEQRLDDLLALMKSKLTPEGGP